jgi:hypothetical protein
VEGGGEIGCGEDEAAGVEGELFGEGGMDGDESAVRVGEEEGGEVGVEGAGVEEEVDVVEVLSPAGDVTAWAGGAALAPEVDAVRGEAEAGEVLAEGIVAAVVVAVPVEEEDLGDGRGGRGRKKGGGVEVEVEDGEGFLCDGRRRGHGRDSSSEKV